MKKTAPNGQEDLDPPEGSTPRKRLPLLLTLLALFAITVVFILLSRLSKPSGTKETEPPRHGAETEQQIPSEGFSASTLAETDQKKARQEVADEPFKSPQEGDQLEPIDVPFQSSRADLEGLVLPACPYSIYAGAYKDAREAETALREHLSHSLPAYIVPIRVEGSLAQSLFGVTQDGLWFRLLVGQYPSVESARKTLKLMMDELSSYQPEIMKFPYALECGRFLESEGASQLSARMTSQGISPYLQTYPTMDGRKLHRILVGCFFSSQGALPVKSELDLQGYSCRIVQR